MFLVGFGLQVNERRQGTLKNQAADSINAREDGGLGLSAKAAQTRLGHSSIAMTLDCYGHLFPSGDDGSALAAAERSLLG
jgi:integrase